MTLVSATASLMHTLAAGGLRQIDTPTQGAGALAGPAPQTGALLTIFLMVIFGVACVSVLLCGMYATHWFDGLLDRKRARGQLGRRVPGATGMRGPSGITGPTGMPSLRQSLPGLPQSARRTLAAGTPPQTPSPAMTAQALRLMESSAAVPANDQAWHALSEEIPGVGRIEWDAETLRAFACQPDVLYRLAFHRWRLQQGMLSEFDLTPPVGRPEPGQVSKPGGSGGGTPWHAGNITTRRVAPTTEGLRALPPGQQGQQASQADG